jgi:molybdopterin molybdotransferase
VPVKKKIPAVKEKAAAKKAAGRGRVRAAKAAVEEPRRVTWMLKPAEDALETILDAVVAVSATEEVFIAACVDRVLARDFVSPLTIPPVDRSERDGYAVRATDTAAAGEATAVSLQQIGHATAGSPFTGRVAAGQCIRIATGSVMPGGTDAVVMFEDVAASDGGVRVTKPVARGAWVAMAGSDFQKGRVVIPGGAVLSPPKLTAAAAMGVAKLKCLRKPKVLVYTTGNEVRRPGEKLREGDVYDGITYPLVALMRQNGCEAHCRRIVRDTLKEQRKALKDAAAKFDAVIFTGGTSVGDRDYGRLALDAEGETLVHGVNVKPGKPLLFGRIGRTPVFGLPGFPVSALLLAYTFVVPAVQKLAGLPQLYEPLQEVVLAEGIRAEKDKVFVVPVRLDEHGNAASAFLGSASIRTVSEADGYIVLTAEEGDLKAGDVGEVRLM